MPEGIELRDYACPQCGARARLDARFIQWCTSCGHNADPKPPQPGKREQRRAERELERSRKLFESLRTARNLRPTSATGVAVTLLSAIVHLITLAVLVLPILLVVETHQAVWSYVLLGFGLLTFIVVRPRLPQRYLDPRKNIDRSMAPRFYELLDQCAAELGCAVPAQIRFDIQFNASTGRSGLRQRRRVRRTAGRQRSGGESHGGSRTQRDGAPFRRSVQEQAQGAARRGS
jgi:hypothetical protein